MIMPNPSVTTQRITYRTMSAMTAPTSGTDRPIGKRAEPVEHALLDVGVQVLAERDAGHRDGLRQQRGQQELQVVGLRPPMAPPKT